jgi:chromosome segregation ATPase
MDSELKTKITSIHDSLINIVTEYYDNKISELENKIEDLSSRLDSQGLVILSLEDEKEKHVFKIIELEKQYTKLEDDFKNYQKVSIVKNLNTQLYERENEIKFLKKKMDSMEMNTIIDCTNVQLVGMEPLPKPISKSIEVINDKPSLPEPELSDEEEIDLIEKKLKPPNGTGRKTYYITDDENRDIYEKLEKGDVGECVGKLVGKSQRPHFFK